MRRQNPPSRRGLAAVVMVVVLIIVDLIIIAIALGGARDQDLTVRRLETVQAFYAAEAGMNMAIRELMTGNDEDGDGLVGTISDDGDHDNNPSLGAARVWVDSEAAGGQTVLTSHAEAGAAARRIEATLE